MNEIKNSLEELVLVRSGNIFGKTDQCSKTKFHMFPGLRFYKNNFHVKKILSGAQPSRNWSAPNSELPCVVALLLSVCIQACCGQLGILLPMYFNCSCMKVCMKVLLLSGSRDAFSSEYSGSQAAKLESRFQTPRAEVCLDVGFCSLQAEKPNTRSGSNFQPPC